MLHFLKNRNEGGASSPVEVIEREPDEGSEYDMLDAIAEDFIAAFESKNKKLMKEALSALVEHIQSEDQEQDEQQSIEEG